MANRSQKAQHDLAYRFIEQRDGNYCLICKIKDGQTKSPPSIKLQIDHADNDPYNWSPDNLHLLCQKHNLQMRQKTSSEHRRLIDECSAANERMRARENRHTPTQLAKEQVDYTSGSVEMQANSIFEQRWLDFMHEWIRSNRSIPQAEAINAGAAVTGCSPSTTSRYLAKYTSSMGCFKISRDSNGAKIVIYRD